MTFVFPDAVARPVAPPTAGTRFFLAQLWKVERASWGILRCGARCKTLCKRWRNPGALLKKLRQPRNVGPQLRPAVDHAEGISMQRTPLVFIIMGQKFRLVRGHIHVGRAFRLARLARQAQVQRFLDVLVLPAVAHDFALQHFKEHVRAPARAVLFLERDHVARAHRTAVVFAALAETDASQRGFGKRPVVIRKLKICFGIVRFVIRSQPQILGGQIGVDHLVRIHLIVRVPRGLEFSQMP